MGFGGGKLTHKLTCVCGKHEGELKKKMAEHEDCFVFLKEMLTVQAREIFEDIEKNNSNVIIDGIFVSKPNYLKIKKKWVKLPTIETES